MHINTDGRGGDEHMDAHPQESAGHVVVLLNEKADPGAAVGDKLYVCACVSSGLFLCEASSSSLMSEQHDIRVNCKS